MNHFPSWTISQTKLSTKALNPSKHSSKTNRTRRWAPPTWDLRKISKGFWFISSPYETVTSSWYCPYVLTQRDELNFIRRVSNIMYKMHWLTLSSHPDSSLFNLPFMLSLAQPLTPQSNLSLFQSVTHFLGLSELSLPSPPIAHSFSQSYIQSPITRFICQKTHSVLILSLSHALSPLFGCSFARSIFHTSQFSFNRSILRSPLIRPFCRSLLLSFHQNIDF